MQLYIPEIGARLKLTADWEFPLFCESRNKALGEALGLKPVVQPGGWSRDPWWQPEFSMVVKVPTGTTLKVDRIYIRKGKRFADFSSLTFIAENKVVFGKKHPRFWAKLQDVNQIQCEWEPTP